MEITTQLSPSTGVLPTVLLVGVFSIFVGNLLRQFAPRRDGKPPVVFHWLPFVGNAVSYGLDPYRFFTNCREKVSRPADNVKFKKN